MSDMAVNVTILNVASCFRKSSQQGESKYHLMFCYIQRRGRRHSFLSLYPANFLLLTMSILLCMYSVKGIIIKQFLFANSIKSLCSNVITPTIVEMNITITSLCGK